MGSFTIIKMKGIDPKKWLKRVKKGHVERVHEV
jgi:hypothetical protein